MPDYAGSKAIETADISFLFCIPETLLTLLTVYRMLFPIVH